MNIQISTLIWAVICFFLFILILNNLLFKPVLACMDARKKKISDAELKHKLDIEHEEEAVVLSKITLQELITKTQAEAKLATDEAYIREERTLSELIAREQSDCQAYQAKLDSERHELEKKTEAEIKRLSELFVSGFVS